MFPLIAGLHLHADRGTRNNDQPDRRNPGQVLEAMRRTRGGVRQLARALQDNAKGHHVLLVDENGRPELDGARAKIARDSDLRVRFPHGSKTARPAGPTNTPAKKLAVKVADLSEIVGKLTEARSPMADSWSPTDAPRPVPGRRRIGSGVGRHSWPAVAWSSCGVA
jgi:hypothetical protein